MRLNIDFSGTRHGVNGRAVLLLVLALAAAIGTTLEGAERYAEHQQAVKTLAGARLQAKRAEGTMPAPQQIDAINRVIRQLNLPWEMLFATVEGNLSDRVALLALEPDATSHIVRIQAEAKTPDDMADFVDALANEKNILSATLTRHEINESDRNRPYRFTLEAAWRAVD